MDQLTAYGACNTWDDANAAVKQVREREDNRTYVNIRMIGETLANAGITAGAFDNQILGWLAKFEPQTVAVICGLIMRANM